jgi:hypothetical protein
MPPLSAETRMSAAGWRALMEENPIDPFASFHLGHRIPSISVCYAKDSPGGRFVSLSRDSAKSFYLVGPGDDVLASFVVACSTVFTPVKTGARNHGLFCFLAEQMCELPHRSHMPPSQEGKGKGERLPIPQGVRFALAPSYGSDPTRRGPSRYVYNQEDRWAFECDGLRAIRPSDRRNCATGNGQIGSEQSASDGRGQWETLATFSATVSFSLAEKSL